MTQSFVKPGKTLALVAPYARASSGLGMLVGSIFAVTTSALADGEEGQGEVEGVHTLLKTSAQAWTVGQKIHWNISTKLLDSDGTTGPMVGVATAIAANPTSTGTIKLTGPQVMVEGQQATIAAVATADSDATYGAAESTLLNELKTQTNLVIAALKAAGIIASS